MIQIGFYNETGQKIIQIDAPPPGQTVQYSVFYAMPPRLTLMATNTDKPNPDTYRIGWEEGYAQAMAEFADGMPQQIPYSAPSYVDGWVG